MQIKRLVIENFKSIERIELIEPNPFTVFVGPNGSGKSNIFEALEYRELHWLFHDPAKVSSLFGGRDKYFRRQVKNIRPTFKIETDAFNFEGNKIDYNLSGVSSEDFESGPLMIPSYAQFVNFTRLFIGNERLVKLNFNDDKRLTVSANNLESVLKRLLASDTLKAEIFEWLELFVPSFKAVEVDDRDELHWFEQSSERYFTKDLISDGTYNILALLTAVYQSDDKPQFLCIEEPENGLHPQVARELVDFFRTMCEERGHYIWLNTHSPYMVSRVRPEELVVVDKVNGATKVKQFKGQEFNGMRMDEAWLTNVLNGGKAW